MNRVLYAADCLDVLNDADALPSASIDLIYLDPPFNSNSTYNLPFKSRDRSLKPVEAFEDTWRWRADDDERLNALEKNPKTRPLATIVQFAQGLESGRGKISLAAYLLNMAQRLYAMKRVLKETGSIYLHCDPTASHYLKLMMDVIYGNRNFKNELIWRRTNRPKSSRYKFPSNHDVILLYAPKQKVKPEYNELTESQRSQYTKIDKWGRYKLAPAHAPEPRSGLSGAQWRNISPPAGRHWSASVKNLPEHLTLPSNWSNMNVHERMDWLYDREYLVVSASQSVHYKLYETLAQGARIDDVWIDIPFVAGNESLGYPTQKPLALMERIIKASSNPGDTVLDPFCGCGTTMHAAETLERKWIGIDISRFSTGLVSRRLLDNFAYINGDDIEIHGTPESIGDARDLAQQDKFEFEKWVCGAMGANGMYKRPGEPGADGGVDGVVELPVIRQVGSKYESQQEYVIIQVKGGNVAPDSVKALSETVRRLGAVAGIMVCFRDQMGTVENQRSKELWADAYQQYPVIQGFSIEDMLNDQRPNLPPTWGYKHGGKTSAAQLL